MRGGELLVPLGIAIVMLFSQHNSVIDLRSDLKSQVISKTDTEQRLSVITEELDWYRSVTKDIFGPNFKPGNLRSTTVNLSSYNPLEEQCDDTPLIASDNGLVAPGILALPQHYRKSLGFELGKLVWIPPYGQFIVRDHMHDRKEVGRGDIISFIPEWSKEFGINNIATMYWVEEKI